MAFRCGYVALVGPPNVGKSTLINRLVGAPLAITTPKPQTTRQRIVGLVHRPAAQMILVDTPGFHESLQPLNQAMLHEVAAALADADVACLLLEPRRTADPLGRRLWERLRGAGKRATFLVLNKMDALPLPKVAPAIAAIRAAFGVEPLTISARHGTGVNALVRVCEAALPEGPALFPDDSYTERPVRFLAAERIREQAILHLGEELPYATAVAIEAFEERGQLTRIRAVLIVEKASQKGIAIGQGGRMIKRIGQRARAQIEALVGTKVYLDLTVRVEAGWTKNPAALKRLGYR